MTSGTQNPMSTELPAKPSILLVEDNEDDVFFMHHALQKAKVTYPMRVVPHGQAALDYLAGTGEYGDRAEYPLPTLIFLDLKMPYVNGFEVLEWMQRQPFTPEIQVVVLTSSPEDRDRQRAKELGARAYLVKPPTEEMILQTIHFVAVRPIVVPSREMAEAQPV